MLPSDMFPVILQSKINNITDTYSCTAALQTKVFINNRDKFFSSSNYKIFGYQSSFRSKLQSPFLNLSILLPSCP